jgi:copper chaperone CopZ
MRATVHIQNLKCGGCKTTIITKLSEVKNISEVDVSLEDSSVSFEYHTYRDYEKAKHRLSMIGYPIMEADNTFFTKAKSYISCAIGHMSKKQ